MLVAAVPGGPPVKAPPHRRVAFYVAAVAGVAAWLGGRWLAPGLDIIIGADTFFVFYLVLALAGMPRLTADFLKHRADSADQPVWIIFVVTLATAVVALVSLFILINRKESPGALALVLTLASVPLGWFTIHTMAALHYAHLYWQSPDRRTPSAGGKNSRRGLQFPGDAEPGGWDFLYFAFVIGMAAQTSDVAVTARAMRMTCLVHSVIAFFFNTVLVAAAVNVVVSLGG